MRVLRRFFLIFIYRAVKFLKGTNFADFYLIKAEKKFQSLFTMLFKRSAATICRIPRKTKGER
jgi:hypothetical protein